MSETYFITPYEPDNWFSSPQDQKPTSDLHIDFNEFEKRFRQEWPNASTMYQSDDSITLRIDEGDERGFEASIYDHQFVAFNYWVKRFVLWYRCFVPVAYRLFASSSSSTRCLELHLDTSEVDLDKFYASD